MKDESEIFKEWLDVTFPGENIDTYECKSLKNTISFQAYFARQRWSEFVSEVLKR